MRYSFLSSWTLLTEINAHTLSLLGAGGGLKFCLQHRTGLFIGGGGEVSYYGNFKHTVIEQHLSPSAQTPTIKKSFQLDPKFGLIQIFPLISVGYDIHLVKKLTLRIEIFGLFGGFMDRDLLMPSLKFLGIKDTKGEIEYGFPIKCRILTGLTKQI